MNFASYLVGGLVYLVLIIAYAFFRDESVNLTKDYVINLGVGYILVVISFVLGDLLVRRNKKY